MAPELQPEVFEGDGQVNLVTHGINKMALDGQS